MGLLTWIAAIVVAIWQIIVHIRVVWNVLEEISFRILSFFYKTPDSHFVDILSAVEILVICICGPFLIGKIIEEIPMLNKEIWVATS